jgi:hypothetical protein
MAYNVLCVANVNQLSTASRADDVIANSSSGGPTPGGRKKPDLAAPGSSLLMPSHYGPATWNRASGTSFSAPAVAGVAALLVDAGVGDPRAVKAVLINSADTIAGGGDAWHPRFGWGYLNGERALAWRPNVVLASLSGTAGDAPVRFFEREAAATTKATAVWHRHVAYDVGEWVTTSPLLDVDLLLYARDTGELRASSRSAIDNVEQVGDGHVEGAVLALVPGSSFVNGTETVALAHSGGFVARAGPGLDVAVSAPETVSPASTFLVTASVTNSGDVKAHGYSATLDVPAGYALVDGTLTRSIGALEAGQTTLLSWTVRAPALRSAAGTFTASASASTYGLSWTDTAQRVVHTDEGCGFVVQPTSVSLPAAGGSATLAVAAPSGCTWTVGQVADWLTATLDASAAFDVRLTPAGTPLGDGVGAVTIAAAPNPGLRRRAALDVAGQPVSITQRTGITRVYYLAEGSTRGIFSLDVAIANPNDEAADVSVSFLQPGAPPIGRTYLLAARSRITIRVDDVPGLESTDVSTVVDSLSGLPLAVERTMTWDGTSYAGHGGTAIEAPSTTWYFAEGSQGFFDTYLLLANPGATDATATVTYLLENGSPQVRTYTVGAQRRTTVYAGLDASLIGRAFSMRVESTAPIIAERAMYWSRPGVFWAGGHESAGVPAPATSWFLAEGATGPYFDEFILIGNPGDHDAAVTITYLLPGRGTVEQHRTVRAQGRLTIDVEAQDERLRDTAVSAIVTSSEPVVVERAMYWPGTSADWQEAHNAFGLTETGLRWALAEGRVGGDAAHETYVLLANPSSEPATVRVRFLREGRAAVEKTVVVPAESRVNLLVVPGPASHAPELVDERFGVLLEVQNGVGIAVERAMYWNSGGVAWAGGTSGVAIALP